MAKQPCALWNPLAAASHELWEELPDTDGLVLFITLAQDPQTGHYTRLTRFLPGADTAFHGAKSHEYVEEIFIIEGEVLDLAFGQTLAAGDYTCRPPARKARAVQIA